MWVVGGSNPCGLVALPGTHLNQHGIPDLKRKGKEVIKKTTLKPKALKL